MAPRRKNRADSKSPRRHSPPSVSEYDTKSRRRHHSPRFVAESDAETVSESGYESASEIEPHTVTYRTSTSPSSHKSSSRRAEELFGSVEGKGTFGLWSKIFTGESWFRFRAPFEKYIIEHGELKGMLQIHDVISQEIRAKEMMYSKPAHHSKANKESMLPTAIEKAAFLKNTKDSKGRNRYDTCKVDTLILELNRLAGGPKHSKSDKWWVRTLYDEWARKQEEQEQSDDEPPRGRSKPFDGISVRRRTSVDRVNSKRPTGVKRRSRKGVV